VGIDIDSTTLLWGVLFGSIGMGYFMYGKKRSRPEFRYTGIALMIYPYFITNNMLVALVGFALLITPKFLKL